MSKIVIYEVKLWDET